MPSSNDYSGLLFTMQLVENGWCGGQVMVALVRAHLALRDTPSAEKV